MITEEKNCQFVYTLCGVYGGYKKNGRVIDLSITWPIA